jgi:benzoyl-CoA reductase subunit D
MNPDPSLPLFAAGIDVGSSAVKVAVMREAPDGSAELCAGRSERLRRRNPEHVAHDLYQACLQEADVRPDDLAYVATTGEGELVTDRTGHFYGMTAHARGGLFLEPEARAIVDVGALHARGVTMDARAKVLGYRMTSQCASGSGQFLENICRYLGITLEEIGPLSLESDAPEPCSSICAVLAETDVINMVSRNISAPNIVKGIHESMAGRYLKLLTSLNVRGVALVTGGLAADVGLLAALREAVAKQGVALEVRAHEHSALAGAIGAALWGAFRARKLARKGIVLA